MLELDPHSFIIPYLALIFAIASFFSTFFKWVKQPITLAYIAGGIILSLFFYKNQQEIHEYIKIGSDIGILFILFGIGLEFSFKKIIRIGQTSCIAAITIVLSMIVLGYLVGTSFGWSHQASFFFGSTLCMSSTIIIVKVFDDLHLNKKKFTEIVLGILIIEDLIAILLMVLFPTIALSQKIEGKQLLYNIIKLATFLSFWFMLCTYLIPIILKKIKHFLNDEILLIFATTFCLGMGFFASQAGYSPGLGAFIMGSILSETIESNRIKHILSPVKNFFGMLFFISIGMLININTLKTSYYIISIGITSITVIIGQLSFATIGTLLSGQNLKTAIFTGFSLTQIGEFSYIISSLGLHLGIIDQFLYQIIITTSIVTSFTTPYMMKLAPIVYNFLNKKLPQKWIHYFNKDTFESSLVKNKNLWKKLLKNMAFIVGIYFFAACAIIFFSLKYGYPIIHKYIPGIQGNLLCSSFIIFFISPFVWMIIYHNKNSTEFIQLWNESEENKMRLTFTIILRIFICIGLIMCILIKLLNLYSIIAFIIALIILIIFLTSKKLHKHSNALDQHFINNLNSKKKYKKLKTFINTDFTDHLMKQDLHLSKFKIESNYFIVGKTLKELNFRQLFGINIIAILRGNQIINIPHGKECIYPKDCLIVFGTDKQMDLFQIELEKTNDQIYYQNNSNEIVLKQFEIRFNSKLIGQTILSLQMQEKYHCLLVGIERNNTSTLKINLTMTFKKGDILWIAGDYNGIQKLKNL